MGLFGGIGDFLGNAVNSVTGLFGSGSPATPDYTSMFQPGATGGTIPGLGGPLDGSSIANALTAPGGGSNSGLQLFGPQGVLSGQNLFLGGLAGLGAYQSSNAADLANSHYDDSLAFAHQQLQQQADLEHAKIAEALQAAQIVAGAQLKAAKLAAAVKKKEILQNAYANLTGADVSGGKLEGDALTGLSNAGRGLFR